MIIIYGIGKQFPNGTWRIDLERKLLTMEVDFLFYMTTVMGIRPNIVADLIRKVISENMEKKLKEEI